MTIFKDRLRYIRKSKGYTQKQVAVAVGASERNYQDWEYGKKKPAFDTLIDLADFFNVTLDYLMGRNDTTKTAKGA